MSCGPAQCYFARVSFLTASEALDLLARDPRGGIDVRSEGEFQRSGVAGFTNLPILNDEERAAVGLCYRLDGQQAAIQLGHSLTEAHRESRVATWLRAGQASPHGFAILCCWRGGLRSQIASEWLSSAGGKVRRVQGGYQAMRRELLNVLEKPPPLLVLGGLTGSGKTALLNELRSDPHVALVDLEALAGHRGSAFGAWPNAEQPRQVWFENGLASELRGRGGPVLVEDESERIGSLFLPKPFLTAKDEAPRILVEEPMAARVARIEDEYVKAPLAAGVTPQFLLESLVRSVQRLRRSLGGAQAQAIEGKLRSAFEFANPHSVWIEALLEHYYDRAYRHASARNERPVVFRGGAAACRDWILAQANSGWRI